MGKRSEQAIVEVILKGQQPNATLKEMQASARELNAQLRRLPVNSKEFAEKSEELKKVNARLKAIQEDVRGTGNLFKKMASEIKSYGMIAMAALSFSWFSGKVESVVKGNAKMSDSFADIRKTTGMTALEVENFNKTLGQMDTRTSTEDLRSIAIAAGQLGISKNDILKFTDSVDKMVVALGDEFTGGAEEVTKVMGGLRNIFTDIKTDRVDQDMLHIGNAINVLASEGAATGPVVSDFANRIGGVAVTLGLTSGQVLGLSATLQELNVSTERGGTAVVKILQKMTTNVKDFAEVAGMDVKDFNHLVNNDLYAAFIKVVEGSKKGGTAATLFGKILKDLDVDGAGASEVIAKLGSNTSMLTEKVNVANNALKGTDSILQEFKLKNETLGAELDRASKNFSSFFTNSGFSNFIKGYVSGLADLFDQTPKFEKLSAAWREQKTLVENLHSELDPLLQRHDELKQKSELTKDEQNELNNIIEQVSKTVPFAVTEFDKYGKAMDISTKKGREFLKMEELKLEVMNREALKAYREELIAVTKEVGEFQKRLNMRDAQGDLYKVVTYQKRFGRETEMTTENMKLTNAEISNMLELLKIAQDKQRGLAATINELKGTAVNSNTDINKSNEKLANDTAYVDEELEKESKRHHKHLVNEYEKFLKDLEELDMKHSGAVMTERDKEVAKVVWNYREILDKQDEFLKNKIITQKQFDDNQKIILEARRLDIQDIDDKYYAKAIKAKLEYEKKKRKLEHNDRQDEIDAINDQFDELVSLAGDNDEELISLEIARWEAIEAIRAKYRLKAKKEEDKADSKNEKNKEKQRLKDQQELYGQFYSTLSDLENYHSQNKQNIFDQEMARVQSSTQSQLDEQKKLLDRKLITQEQYDKKVEGINADAAKKEKQLNIKRAKEEKNEARFSAILNTAEAVTAILAKHAANPIIAAFLTAGALTKMALQLSLIESAPLPQYASGGFHKPDGFVNSETMFSSASGQPFIAGEKGSEWIAPNWMLKNPVTANYIDMLEAVRSGRSFAAGGNTSATTSVQPGNTAPANLAELASSINQLNSVISRLQINGIQAIVVYDEFKKVNASIDNAKALSRV